MSSKPKNSAKKKAPPVAAATACSPSDPFVRHEVMDRASILMEMLDRSLGEHPGMVNGNLREIYGRAETALSDLYQEAGRISFEENGALSGLRDKEKGTDS
jgi:hypothetical protein